MQKRMSGFKVRADKSKTERAAQKSEIAAELQHLYDYDMRELSRYAPPTCVVTRPRGKPVCRDYGDSGSNSGDGTLTRAAEAVVQSFPVTMTTHNMAKHHMTVLQFPNGP